jgi:predicted metalloprotease with PDZ domain
MNNANHWRLWCAAVVAGVLGAAAVFAQQADAPPIVNKRYAGELTLAVDLTDAARKIVRVHETIPVAAGSLALYYPKWIPGEHAPSGPITGITALKISAHGTDIAWHRDLVDMYTLHLTVPSGVTALDVDFAFLSPLGGGEFGQSASITPRIAVLEWNQVLFYPAGYGSHSIEFAPSIKLLPGWGFGTALERASGAGDEVHFKPVNLATLIDSPLLAGANFRRVDLAPGAHIPVRLDIAADHAGDLAMTEQQIAQHRALVEQAYKLFGARHYAHYDFLLTLSENTGHFGLEHHESSDDRTDTDFFTDPQGYLAHTGLLPHEYVHSWNGKYRRPADLWTPNFNVPMRDDLLWVYEGLTEYYGDVLSARSNMRSAQEYRDALAASAAGMAQRPGRSWRPLQDTADEAQILYYTPSAWSNWQRDVDFYDEGELLWLDVDTLIREKSHGQHSLDDFAHAFYGINDGVIPANTYTFDDVVAALNAVQPADWRQFLRHYLDVKQQQAPLDGITRGGWQLTYSDKPSEFSKADDKERKHANFMASLGVLISTDSDEHRDGELIDVLWNSPAFAAGLAPAMKLLAVNGEEFKPERLADAIRAAQHGKKPLALLVQNLDYFITINVDYHGGLKYPVLTRLPNSEDRLSNIIKPRS